MKKQNKTRAASPVRDSVKDSLRRHRGGTALMALCILGSVVTALLPPLVLERGVDLIAARQPIPLTLALIYLLLIFLADALESAQGAAITILGQKVTRGLRERMCQKLDRLPTQYFRTHDSGRTASLFVNDADTIDGLYSNGIVGMIADSFKVISIVVMVFTKSVGLGLCLLLAAPLLFLLTRLFQKRTLSAQIDNRKAIARVSGRVPETIRNIRMIHVFAKERWMEKKYDGDLAESYRAVNRSNIYDSIYSPIILLTQSLIIAVMMVCAAQGGGLQRLFGLTAGSAVAVIAYVGKVFSPLESLGMEIQNIQAAMSGIRRIDDFLREEEWDPAADPAEPAPDAPCSLTADHVTFGYTAGRTVLQDLSFSIQEGEQVTFMGRTGSGKTTIFNLLTGLYAPRQGSVRVAGVDPCRIPAGQRRKLFGIVEQKFTPVPGTIRDQLSLYDPAISEEEMLAALDLTGLRQAVEALPRGLDTPFEAAGLSQGQLQLLSIARAVTPSPRLLLLDEITASLDSETEAKVLSALRGAVQGRTVVSISHRLSAVLEGGRTIAIGRAD